MCEQQSIRAVWSELLWVVWIFLNVKLLTEHYLELLILKGGSTGSSYSTLVRMPHCWISHLTAHMYESVMMLTRLDSRTYFSSCKRGICVVPKYNHTLFICVFKLLLFSTKFLLWISFEAFINHLLSCLLQVSRKKKRVFNTKRGENWKIFRADLLPHPHDKTIWIRECF